MREIRTSGSEGGGAGNSTGSPYPYQEGDAILEVKRELRRSAEEIGSTRMNRAVVLGRLRRFGEAKAELEACLEIFRNDPTRRARTLSSLAALLDEQGDLRSAIEAERSGVSAAGGVAAKAGSGAGGVAGGGGSVSGAGAADSPGRSAAGRRLTSG